MATSTLMKVVFLVLLIVATVLTTLGTFAPWRKVRFLTDVRHYGLITNMWHIGWVAWALLLMVLGLVCAVTALIWSCLVFSKCICRHDSKAVLPLFPLAGVATCFFLIAIILYGVKSGKAIKNEYLYGTTATSNKVAWGLVIAILGLIFCLAATIAGVLLWLMGKRVFPQSSKDDDIEKAKLEEEEKRSVLSEDDPSNFSRGNKN